MTTLGEALKIATKHWQGRPGGGTMVTMASACVQHMQAAFGEPPGDDLSLDSLGSPQAVSLLAYLRDTRGLSPRSSASYYGAFRRMCLLAGYTGNVTAWPSAPSVPRVKARQPITGDDLGRLIKWFRAKGWATTADLAVVLRGTGLRVQREALDRGALSPVPSGSAAYDVLRVVGKGGHERFIPVVDPECRAVLSELRGESTEEPAAGASVRGCSGRLEELRRVPYATHLDRWNKGTQALNVKTKLPTPHSVRHLYLSEADRKSGGNVSLVQSLAGHASPATTARYIEVDFADKVEALS